MTPKQALLPIIIVAVGIGFWYRTWVVILFAVFFPIINTAAGVRYVDRELRETTQAFQTGRWRMFTRVYLPAAAPFVVAGIRLGFGMAIKGMVIAELWIFSGPATCSRPSPGRRSGSTSTTRWCCSSSSSRWAMAQVQATTRRRAWLRRPGSGAIGNVDRGKLARWALGLHGEIGSLEPGKKADFVLFGLDHSEWVPYRDPVQALVWSATSASIRQTWVDGRPVLVDGALTTLPDEPELRAEARARADRLIRAAGLDAGDVPLTTTLYQ